MRKLIIDTDCGVDDATAILLTLASKKVELVAITCVAGNTTLENVLNNVGRVLETAGHPEIPIYAGADENLMRNTLERWKGHGNDGFGNVDMPNTTLKPKSNRHAALEIIDLVNKYGKDLDIVTIGPLTNIAIALSLDPQLLDKINNLTMMIGTNKCMGNISAMAEFNSYYDPEAAHIVFKMAKNATIASWDLTFDNLVSWSTFDKVRSGTKSGELVGKIFNISERLFRKKGFYNIPALQGWCIPDPLCLLCYLYPEIVTKSENKRMSIATSGEARGALIYDYNGQYNIGNTQNYITQVDHEKVEELLVQLFTH